MVLENEADYKSRSQAVASIAEKFGCSSATLRGWINRQAIEDGDRDGLTQSDDFVPWHGFETARYAGHATILTPVAASGSRAFCSALI
jgi:transposase-like protein